MSSHKSQVVLAQAAEKENPTEQTCSTKASETIQETAKVVPMLYFDIPVSDIPSDMPQGFFSLDIPMSTSVGLIELDGGEDIIIINGALPNPQATDQ